MTTKEGKELLARIEAKRVAGGLQVSIWAPRLHVAITDYVSANPAQAGFAGLPEPFAEILRAWITAAQDYRSEIPWSKTLAILKTAPEIKVMVTRLHAIITELYTRHVGVVEITADLTRADLGSNPLNTAVL